jgi:hypothetical protein
LIGELAAEILLGPGLLLEPHQDFFDLGELLGDELRRDLRRAARNADFLAKDDVLLQEFVARPVLRVVLHSGLPTLIRSSER